MSTSSYRTLFVEALAARLRRWQDEGKLDEEDLDRALSAQARAWVDGVCEASTATPSADVETLVALVAEQLGGDAALSDLAAEIASGWLSESPFEGLLRSARALVDGPGFVASQASEWLVDEPDWSYTGGHDSFALRLRGVSSASPATKALLGTLLARLAGAASRSTFDIRLEGLDGGELVVSGRLDPQPLGDPSRQTRLHRAALVP